MSDEARSEAERELQLLAVLERFAGEAQAGAAPRLAMYVERYPGFAAELVEFASGYLLGTADADVAGSAKLNEGWLMPEGELSAGSRRALAMLFPESARRGEAVEYAAQETGELRAVAERRAEYDAGSAEPGGAKGSSAEEGDEG